MKRSGPITSSIDIAAPRGTPVRAAQNGVVAYAGNELKGFGNLLLVRHANGWMTAYAHNDSLVVKEQQDVRKGQKIGGDFHNIPACTAPGQPRCVIAWSNRRLRALNGRNCPWA